MTGEKNGGTAEHARGARSGPTQQWPNAAGPGNAHGAPPGDAPGPWGTGERPFHPEDGKPARDPDKAAAELLARANGGPQAAGDAGPEAAGDAGEKGGSRTAGRLRRSGRARPRRKPARVRERARAASP